MSDSDNVDLLEKRRDIIVEINARTFDKAASYTNLVTLGGYAGAFTVWAYTRDQLTDRATIIIALLLGVSLAVFVLFEVYKTMRLTKSALRFRDLLMKDLPAKEFIDEAKKLQIEDHSNLYRVWLRIWMSAWYFSVITALLALAILFYNFVAILVDWPVWPTQGPDSPLPCEVVDGNL